MSTLLWLKDAVEVGQGLLEKQKFLEVWAWAISQFESRLDQDGNEITPPGIEIPPFDSDLEKAAAYLFLIVLSEHSKEIETKIKKWNNHLRGLTPSADSGTLPITEKELQEIEEWLNDRSDLRTAWSLYEEKGESEKKEWIAREVAKGKKHTQAEVDFGEHFRSGAILPPRSFKTLEKYNVGGEPNPARIKLRLKHKFLEAKVRMERSSAALFEDSVPGRRIEPNSPKFELLDSWFQSMENLRLAEDAYRKVLGNSL